MLDAVILANALYEIANDPTTHNIHVAFKEYYRERFSHAKSDQESSQQAARLLAGQVNELAEKKVATGRGDRAQ